MGFWLNEKAMSAVVCPGSSSTCRPGEDCGRVVPLMLGVQIVYSGWMLTEPSGLQFGPGTVGVGSTGVFVGGGGVQVGCPGGWVLVGGGGGMVGVSVGTIGSQTSLCSNAQCWRLGPDQRSLPWPSKVSVQ